MSGILTSNSIAPPATTDFAMKDESDEQECINSTPPPVRSISTKSADESQYTATSSPSSTINVNNNNPGGNNEANNNAENGSLSIAGSSTTSSSGQMTTESPESSTEASQRASFDFNSLFSNSPLNNNNNTKSSPFDFGLPTNEVQHPPTPFNNPFPGLPFPALDPGTIMQLSQMLGSRQYPPLQQNPSQPLNVAFIHEQMRRRVASLQKPDSLPTFKMNIKTERQNNNRQTQNDSGDRKRSYPYTFQFCVLCEKDVHSSKLPCHIRQCHIVKPMFKCPSCDFTSTYSKNNVKSHMVSLHGLAEEPISYMEQYSGQVEEFMKKCFPNVRGRGRPVHGRPPRSPMSSMVNQQRQESNRQGNTPNTQQIAAARNQRQRNPSNVVNSQMLVANRLNEMIAMINEQTSNNEAAKPLNHLNPFACLPTFKYMKQELTDTCAFRKLDDTMKQWKKEPTEQISMEQLLQNFGARISAPIVQQQPSIDESQPAEHKQCFENDDIGSVFQPRYSPKNLKFSALSRSQLSSTVFSTLDVKNPVDFITKLDLSQEVESLINESSVLLTKEQAGKIADVRSKLQLLAFEVLFAIHRLDLDILPLPKLELVASIAPSEIDSRRFALFEQSNNMRNSEEEEFIVQLSKAERLREKLIVMRLMGAFDQNVQRIGQQLHDLNAAAKLLHNSSEFHTIIQMLLVCANVINGDPNAEVVAGFQISSILDICSFEFPNGQSLLYLLVSRIPHKFPELKNFFSQCAIIESAANTDFEESLNELRGMEQAKQCAEAELEQNSNEVLSEFLKRANAELSQLQESSQITKEQLLSTLKFFGEPVNNNERSLLHPERFFSKVAEFLANFKKSYNEF